MNTWNMLLNNFSQKSQTTPKELNMNKAETQIQPRWWLSHICHSEFISESNVWIFNKNENLIPINRDRLTEINLCDSHRWG